MTDQLPPNRPPAEVTESPRQLDVVVTIPTFEGPKTLSMAVLQDEETDEWEVILPLWPKLDDLVRYHGVSCVTEDFQRSLLESDVDQWDVFNGTASFADTVHRVYEKEADIEF